MSKRFDLTIAWNTQTWIAEGFTNINSSPCVLHYIQSLTSTLFPSFSSTAELNAVHREREERIKQLKEKQNEERQRKLEELKAQALAAQKFREQKEEERRRRMEDLRNRENDRRQQVEERKKQIWEAERERREYILRKDSERQTRLENKRKNDRSNIVFAFGSSTPRMIETVDCSGMGMSASFWATRRLVSMLFTPF